MPYAMRSGPASGPLGLQLVEDPVRRGTEDQAFDVNIGHIQCCRQPGDDVYCHIIFKGPCGSVLHLRYRLQHEFKSFTEGRHRSKSG